MKTNIEAYKYINAIMALKGERWNYLFALGAVLSLTIILIYSIVINSYDLASVISTSNQEIANIAKLHETITRDSVKPANNSVDNLHLFGVAPVVSQSITSSNFRLLGIEYSNQNPSQAKAIISSDSDEGKDGIYRVGDKLPQGAIINSIGIDHVIILDNGTLEKIYLKWNQEDQITTPSPSLTNRVPEQ